MLFVLRRMVAACAGVMALTTPLVVAADTFPSKPLRIVVPYPPGGVADTVTRKLAMELGNKLGQSVIVENRAGGMQIPATENVVRAAPDGYSLLLASTTNMVLNAVNGQPLSYQPRQDLVPIVRFFNTPLFLIVPVGLPVHSVEALQAYARKNDGRLNFASVGPGTTTHLAGELFKLKTGLDLVHIPYRGSGPALLGLISNETQLMFDGGTSALAQVSAGKARVLAMTGPSRASTLPDIPTMMEEGVKDYEMTAWWGIVAPKGTPQPIVDKLNAAINEIIAQDAFSAPFAAQGVQMDGGSTQDFQRFIDTETEKYTDLIKQSGIRFN